MKRGLIILLLPALLAGAASGQEREAASINYGVSQFRYHDTAARAGLLDLKLRLPVWSRHGQTVSVAVGYRNLSLNDFPEGYTRNLHGVTMQAAWLYKVTGKKSIMLFAQCGLFSDMRDISRKDFRYSAGFRYRVKHTENLSTGWGLAYSRQFFGNQLVPFIDIDYRPGGRWSITGQFPVRPEVLYHFNRKLSAGIEINGDAASYRLSASERENQFIQINQWKGLAVVEWRFAANWKLGCGVGKNMRETYRLYNDASSSRWTVITIPLGAKPGPVATIDSKGMVMQLGVFFTPFGGKGYQPYR